MDGNMMQMPLLISALQQLKDCRWPQVATHGGDFPPPPL
jgi:hypothetical protein